MKMLKSFRPNSGRFTTKVNALVLLAITNQWLATHQVKNRKDFVFQLAEDAAQKLTKEHRKMKYTDNVHLNEMNKAIEEKRKRSQMERSERVVDSLQSIAGAVLASCPLAVVALYIIWNIFN